MKYLILPFIIMLILSNAQLVYAQCLGDKRIDARYELKNNDICEGETIEMENVSEEFGNTNAFYIWNWGDGQIDTVYELENRTHVYNFPDLDICSIGGEKALELRLDAKVPGCEKYNHFVVKPIFIKLKPKAKFSAPESVCAPNLEVNFNDNSCSAFENPTLSWNFGDPNSGSNTSSEATPTHIFSGPGTYNVSFTVQDSCGAATGSKAITVYGIPEAKVLVNLNPANGCAPVIADFTNQSINFTQVKWKITPNQGWEFTDTIYSLNSFNNQILFFEVGKYEVELTAENPCEKSIWTQTIDIFQSPTVNLKPFDSYCESAEIKFCDFLTTTGTVTATNWTIIEPDGNSINLSDCPSQTFTKPGLYQVKVEIDGGSCENISQQDTFFLQTPDGIDFTGNPTEVCSTDEPFQLIASPPGGVWKGSIAVNADGKLDPAKADADMIELRYDPPGDCANEGIYPLMILAADPISISENPVICKTENQLILDFNPVGGTWTGEGITDSINGVFNPQLTGIGKQPVAYTFIDAQGCSITKTTEIDVEDLPTIAEQSKEVAFCETTEDISLNSAINLSFSPSNGTLTWSGIGVINEQSGIFNSSKAGATGEGIYTLKWVYQLAACSISDSVEIQVAAKQTAFAGNDTTLCLNEPLFQLIGSPGGGMWKGPGVNETTGEIDLEKAGGGEKIYTYLFSEGTTCEVKDEVKVDIKDLSGVSAGGNIEICGGSSSFQLNNFTPSGGKWSAEKVAINESGNIDPTGLPPGDYQLIYCIETTDINCSACDELTLTIKSLPSTLFTIEGTTCVNETLILENQSENGKTFDWKSSDGKTSDEVVPLFSYDTVGNYTIELEVTSEEGCTSSFSREVSVTEPPKVAFDKNQSEGCAPLAVDFTNQSSGTDISYLWDFGNGDSLEVENPNTIIFEQGNKIKIYPIQLEITNVCGTVIALDSVTVFPLPIVDFGTNVDDGCSPLEIEISNITKGNPETFEWSLENVFFSNDSTIGNQVFTTTDSTISKYPITLIATNNCGVDSLTKSITVFPPNVDAFLSVDTSKGCQPLEVQFTNFSTPGAIINWDFGDGNGSSETTTSHIYDSAGVFTVYQYAANCGVDLDSIVIEVLPSPTVSFESSDFACERQPIEFLNQSTDIISSQWDFGNGEVSVLNNPTYIFDSIGIYNISLTGISTFNNCPSIFQQTIEVLGKPHVDFEPSSFNGCPPLEIKFTNKSVDNLNFAWDFGDSTGDSLRNPVHKFINSGTYTVNLRGTDDFGCFGDTSVLNIIVHAEPESIFSTNESVHCNQVDTIFFQNHSINASQHLWIFGTTDSSKQQMPIRVFEQPGEVHVTLITTNEFGCKDQSFQNLLIEETPQAILPETSFRGCSSFTVSFNNISKDADAYIWNFGDGNTSTEHSPQHKYLNAGEYQTMLVAKNSNGCPSDTLITPIKVNEIPKSDFILSDSFICGIPVIILGENKSIGGLDYTWDFGDGQSSKDKNVSIPYNQAGDYLITLEVKNEHNCIDNFSKKVSVNEQPLAEFELQYAQNCEEDEIIFLNHTIGATNFIWDFGDGQQSKEKNPIHKYSSSGTYNVKLIANYQEVCYDSIFLQNTISILDAPKATFQFSDQGKGFIQFINLSTGGSSYYWDFGDGDFSTEYEPLHEYENNGSYQVTLMVTHSNGCVATISNTINPSFFGQVYFPNAFSPATGIGEVRLFKPKGKGLASFRLQVYSPYGQLVFDQQGVEGEEPAIAWDGLYKNKILPQGAYAWKATMQFLDGRTKTSTGSVILLR